MTDNGGQRPLSIAVIGAGDCDDSLAREANLVGAEIARRGSVLICGGRSGVMAAASQGARLAGGTVVGVLPGRDAIESPPNTHVSLALFTGLGQARNLVVVLSAAAVIAIGGGWGTLSEIALARKHGIPVVFLGSWALEPPASTSIEPPLIARDARDAVELAHRWADRRRLGIE
ncbi:MAG: TIGR00725 family protein [Acidobacteriota bacterium]